MNKTLRFSLLSMMMMLCGSMFAQTEVTLDFDNDYATLFPTLAGVSTGDSHDGDFTENTTSTAVNGVTVTVSAKASGNNENRIWSSAPRLRMYSGTFTVTGKDITKIEFTGHSTNFNLSTETGTLTEKTWTGKADEVVFTVSKNTQINKIVVTMGGEEVNPGDVAKTLYTEAFTSDQGKFTIDDKNLPEGLTYIWKFNNYGAVASAYANSTNYDTESWLISPVIDLSKATETTLEFTHALNYFSSIDVAKEQATVLVKIGDGSWEVLDGVTYPASLGWSFVENSIDVSSKFDGKKVQVAFRYVSTAEKAGTWEIKPFTIKGKGEATIEGSSEPVETTKAANIAALQALANGTLAEVTLNNAQVLYVNNYNGTKEVFIRDASGAADFYDLGINAEEGQTLNGTIIGTRGERSGFTTALLKAEQTNAATVTVGAAQEVKAVEMSIDEASAYYCDYVVVKNVTTDGKNAINEDGDQLPLYDRFQLKLLGDLKTDGTKYDIYGLMYDGGEKYGAELVVTKVTLAGGGDVQEEDPTAVENIAALLALESGSSNLELTLTNAKVLLADGSKQANIYVRDETGAVCFYQMPDEVKAKLTNNAVVNGKIRVDYSIYRLLPEATTNKYTSLENLTITESDEEATPVSTTLAEVAQGKNVCDLVTLKATLVKDVTYKEDGTVQSTTYKLQDGDVTLVVVNNSKNLSKIDEGAEIVVTGIVNTANDAYQVKLTKNAEDVTSVSNITVENATEGKAYNVAGQRVNEQFKGIVIKNGKKFVVK